MPIKHPPSSRLRTKIVSISMVRIKWSSFAASQNRNVSGPWRVQDTARRQIRRQLLGRAVVDRRHAGRLAAFDVEGRVVDEQAVAGLQPVTLEQDPVDGPIRLADPLIAGDDDAVEQVQEGEALDHARVGLGGKVGDRVQRPAGRLEGFQDIDRRLDRARDHLVPAFGVKANQGSMFGKAGAAFGHRIGPRAAEILLMVPLRRADVGQEILHRRMITGKDATIEVARVPVDQHPSEIEHDGRGHCSPLFR